MLRWIPTVLQHGGDPLFTTQMNAPEGVNLMWNSSIPAVALLMTPVTMAAGPVVAYNVALVLAIVTSGLAAWAAARRYVDGLVGPLVAGAVYAFSSIHHRPRDAAPQPHVRLCAAADAAPARRAGRAPAVEPAADRRGDRIARGPRELYVFEEVWRRWPWPRRYRRRRRVARRGRGCPGPGRDPGRRAGVAMAAIPAASRSCCWRHGRSPCSSSDRAGSRAGSRMSRTSRRTCSTSSCRPPTPSSRHRRSRSSPATSARCTTRATAYIGIPLLLVLVVLVVTRWSDPRVRVGGLVALVLFVLSLGPVLHLATEDTGIPIAVVAAGPPAAHRARDPGPHDDVLLPGRRDPRRDRDGAAAAAAARTARRRDRVHRG